MLYSCPAHVLLMPSACFPLAYPLLPEAFSPLVLHLFFTCSPLLLHLFFILSTFIRPCDSLFSPCSDSFAFGFISLRVSFLWCEISAANILQILHTLCIKGVKKTKKHKLFAIYRFSFYLCRVVGMFCLFLKQHYEQAGI